MDLIIPSIFSLICIIIMIGAIIIAFVKKFLLTYVFIASNFIIFVITIIQPEIISELGFRPIYLSIEYLPQIYTIFTSMFLHGGFMHIIGNMIILLFMGMAFEQRIGMKNFLAIYILTGICAALSHSFIDLRSDVPLIGASGAIFGIMGAFAYSYPKDEVIMPIPLGIIMIFRRIKVMYAVVMFAILETIIVFYEAQTEMYSNTAHLAHVGGLLSGVVIAVVIIGKQGEKTKNGKQTAIYYDSEQMPKKKQIDFKVLKKLAITPELRDMLKRIENETVMQVRDIWLEHFFEKITCPICGKQLNHNNKKIWCKDEHVNMEY